jgi:hypothetical protein
MASLCDRSFFFQANHNDATIFCMYGTGLQHGFWAILGLWVLNNSAPTRARAVPPYQVWCGGLTKTNLMFVPFQDTGSMVQSGIVTGIIVITVAVTSAWFTEETFHKDLDYIEPE